ncbi:MAG: MarR family transcriptional regulator [Rhizobiales bacterium]|nr:MarR family transcriptional regulator [Hyphomicrobiales bacterium]
MTSRRTGKRQFVPLIVANVFQLAGAFRDHGERIARTAGQSQARWQVMSAASAEPKTVAQVARRLGITRQGVQRLADLLVREDMAEYQANPDHRGSPHLILTRQGRSALAKLTAAADAYHTAVAAPLSEAELRRVHDGLKRLLGAVDRAGLPSGSQQAEE